MVLKKETVMILRYLFASSLGFLILGMVINGITAEKSALAMLLVSLGWLGACANGAVLATRRTVCPRCQIKLVPLSKVSRISRKPCQYCSDSG